MERYEYDTLLTPRCLAAAVEAKRCLIRLIYALDLCIYILRRVSGDVTMQMKMTSHYRGFCACAIDYLNKM